MFRFWSARAVRTERDAVIIHYHIFKNAGSSVDAALQRQFGDAWDTFEGQHAHDILSHRRLADYLKRRPRLRALSTHLGRPPLPSRRCYPMVFLRHPLLRAKSVYSFVRRDPQQPQHGVAKRESFAGFVDHYMRDDSQLAQVIRNYQVFHLSGAAFGPNHTRRAVVVADFEKARRLLAGWGFAGIVERFDESLKIYSRRYAPFFVDFDLASFRENVTQSVVGADQDTRIAALEDELGGTLAATFRNANRQDFRLYDWASARFFSTPR